VKKEIQQQQSIEIDGVIKDWLWLAKDREGGRKKRELEKKKKQDNAIENGNDNDNESNF
jgi:hypothetical protein